MASVPHDKGYQGYKVLQVAFVIVPLIAGLDKFFNLLTNWAMYLSPLALQVLHGKGSLFMMLVGIVEIIAGLGMIFKPKLFAYIVSLWLLLIVINLIMLGHYYDIALRDVGLMLGAFACGKLSQVYCRK